MLALGPILPNPSPGVALRADRQIFVDLRNGSHKQHKTIDFYRDECPTQVSVILSTKFSNPPCKDRAASINPQVGAGQATERLHILENCGHGANMTTCHTMGGHSNGTIWSQNIPGQT